MALTFAGNIDALNWNEIRGAEREIDLNYSSDLHDFVELGMQAAGDHFLITARVLREDIGAVTDKDVLDICVSIADALEEPGLFSFDEGLDPYVEMYISLYYGLNSPADILRSELVNGAVDTVAKRLLDLIDG